MLMRTVLMAPVALAVITMRPEPVVTLDHPPPKATVQAAPPGKSPQPEAPEPAVVEAPAAKPTAPPPTKVAKTPGDENSAAFKRSLRCLALNIYHEARSESDEGQLAVAAVTLNRVASESFPDSVCSVVEQGGQKRHHCQFSWWCDGRKDTPTETKAWQKAIRISRLSLDGISRDPTHGALYYHTTAVKPKWSRTFKRTAHIGRHVFYKPAKSAPVQLAGLD